MGHLPAEEMPPSSQIPPSDQNQLPHPVVVETVPAAWGGGKVQGSYDALYGDSLEVPPGTPHDAVLDDDHPLAQAAVRWVRGSRFDPDDDHRVAVRSLHSIDAPDLVATFLVTLRAGDNTEMERLLAVRVGAGGAIDAADAVDLIDGQGVADVPDDKVRALFTPWWESARRAAGEEAHRRAEGWKHEVRAQRLAEHAGLRDRFKTWAEATRRAILGQYDDPGLFLPGLEKDLPPTVRRRMREHRKDVNEYEAFLERRLRFEPAAVEPLGVLLRVPAREARA
jgi:hypothetical protein